MPYSRSGPSLFVHGPDLLIDTPEEIRSQLTRSKVGRVAAGTYSHWHPDHVAGVRVWGIRNCDWVNWPPHHESTPIYIPEQVSVDFRRRLGIWENLTFLQRQGFVDLIELADGEAFQLQTATVKPFRLAEDYVYGFLIQDGGSRVLICPDETLGWRPSDEHRDVDLAVLPMGLSAFHPLTGKRMIPVGHPVLNTECSFEETLEIVSQLRAKRTILAHIEEPDGCSHDDLLELESRLSAEGEGGEISFAYDTLTVEV